MASQRSPQSLVVASRMTLARASQNLQSDSVDPWWLSLGQPELSLHYSGGHLQRSMPPRERGSPIWPPAFRIAGVRMLQYPDCFVSGGRSAESNGWRKIECTTSSSSAAAAPV